MKNRQKHKIILFLHDIRSVQNVASLFRLGECLGIAQIILSGTTPGPIDRFLRVREDFAKISLGAENSLPWERIGKEIQSLEYTQETAKENLEIAIKYLQDKKEKGSKIIALEQDERSVDYKSIEIKEDVEYVVVLGREVEGIHTDILSLADVISEITQYGEKESLNVVSAASVALYRWFDK